MNILEFIETNENWEESLKNDFGISVKRDTQVSPHLASFTYDQIASPKTHPLTRECRGLVIDTLNLKIAGRPFERFYNYGEVANETLSIDFSNCSLLEKLDGSLLTFYFSQEHNLWKVATKSTPFSRNAITKSRIPFLHLVCEALSIDTGGEYYVPFQENFLDVEQYNHYINLINEKITKDFNKNYSYIFELVSPENCIITKYDSPELYLLAARNTDNGEYIDTTTLKISCVKFPCSYPVRSKEEALELIQKMNKGADNLKEGVVVVDNKSGIRAKIKNSAYLKVHKLMNRELDEKAILDIVADNEEDEYLAYYPNDVFKFAAYIVARNKIIDLISEGMRVAHSDAEQKNIAEHLKSLGVASFVFPAVKKGITSPSLAFSNGSKKLRMQLLSKMK